MELKVLKNEAPDIHPSAVIHPSAIIHKNVVIGAYAYIGENCEIGEGTIIGPHAVIAKNVRMGKENHIYPHAVIGEDRPRDFIPGQIIKRRIFYRPKTWPSHNNFYRICQKNHRESKEQHHFCSILQLFKDIRR